MPALKTIHLVLGGAFVFLGVLFILARAGVTLKKGRLARALGLGTGAMLGLGFGGLTFWTLKLPVLRGSMWSLKDTLVKAGAIVSGVLFLLTLLTALLPWVLDRLEA